MAERKHEATAYFSSEASDALDVLSDLAGVSRSEWVSRVVIDALAHEVDKANMVAARMAGKRIMRKGTE